MVHVLLALLALPNRILTRLYGAFSVFDVGVELLDGLVLFERLDVEVLFDVLLFVEGWLLERFEGFERLDVEVLLDVFEDVL